MLRELDRRAVGIGQLPCVKRGQPIAPKQLSHRRAGAGSHQQLVLFRQAPRLLGHALVRRRVRQRDGSRRPRGRRVKPAAGRAPSRLDATFAALADPVRARMLREFLVPRIAVVSATLLGGFMATQRERIGFIGLGSMGRPMATRIAVGL